MLLTLSRFETNDPVAWKQNILVIDFHLLKSLLVVFGFESQANLWI